MSRLCVLLSVIPCLLLSQAAAGQWHAGERVRGHNARPHLHANPFTPHASHCCHHSSAPGDDAGSARAAAPTECPCHDDVNDVTLDLVTSKRSLADGDDGFVWPLAAELATPCLTGLRGPSVRPAHSPRLPGAFDCPIYVRHLTLLV